MKPKIKEHISNIFIGIQGLGIVFLVLIVNDFILFNLVLFAWIGHCFFYIGFAIKTTAWRRNRKRAVGFLLIGLIFLVTFSYVFQIIIKANKQVFEPTLGLDNDLGNIYTKGVLQIEIDYSEDLDLPWGALLYFGKEAFSRIGAQVIFHVDPMDEVSIKFNSTNMEAFAELMNETRNHPNAIHCLILHNGSIEGITTFLGYAPRSKYWAPAMVNHTDPRFTGCMVFTDEIFKGIDPIGELLQFVKCVLHEIGHYLNADHSNWGIMKQGSITSVLELFFDVFSQAQMNIYNKWSVEKGFFIYY